MDSALKDCLMKDTALVAVLYKKDAMQGGAEKLKKSMFAITLNGDLETINAFQEFVLKEYTGIFKTNRVSR